MTSTLPGLSSTTALQGSNRRLDPLLRPRSIVFVGGTNMLETLRYQREMGFTGDVWVVNPHHARLDDYPCVPSVRDLPSAPDLAYVAIRRELAVDVISELRQIGCRAVICHAAGFAEAGPIGEQLNTRLLEAAGDMALLGPNVLGVINIVDRTAVAMEHYGILHASEGVAIVSQGGTLLADAASSARHLAMTHLIAVGNQAQIQTAECVDYLLDDPRVKAIGLSFETLRDVDHLRRVSQKALHLGKPIVAMKLGNSAAGAVAAASHTASMTGSGAAWDALFDRLGIVATRSQAEFFETLKLFASGRIPRGPRAAAISASGVYSILMADHLTAGGFELRQPIGERRERLRQLLPAIATPGNPLDITAAVWGQKDLQKELFSTLAEEDVDILIGVQNYPLPTETDLEPYLELVDSLGAAAVEASIPAIQLAPLADSYPAEARDRAVRAGLTPMLGLDESVAALRHGLWWHRRRGALVDTELTVQQPEVPTIESLSTLDEASAKMLLAEAGVPVPASRSVDAMDAWLAASELGYPVVIKALDARLIHKSDVGAVRLGLRSADEVSAAVEAMREDMARLVPHIPLRDVLVESMVQEAVAEVLVSISHDPSVGFLMMLAGGGVEAELWNDSILLAAPFTRLEILRALEQLKVTSRIRGWRGGPIGDLEAVIEVAERLGRFAAGAHGPIQLEINPLLVGRNGATAVDAVLSLHSPQQ